MFPLIFKYQLSQHLKRNKACLLFSLVVLLLISITGVSGYKYYQAKQQLDNQQLTPSSLKLVVNSPSSIVSSATEIDTKPGWKTYINHKYKFTMNYPPTWKYIEIPISKYNMQNDQVWFNSGDITSISPNLMVDIKITISKVDPSLNWQPKYFNYYNSRPYQLDSVSAKIISGDRKGSNVTETVILAKIGDYHIQIAGFEGSENWNQILSTFQLTD